MDEMARIVHLACCALGTVPYFEYIESAANWSDEISREGAQGNWATNSDFAVAKCGVAVEVFSSHVVR